MIRVHGTMSCLNALRCVIQYKSKVAFSTSATVRIRTRPGRRSSIPEPPEVANWGKKEPQTANNSPASSTVTAHEKHTDTLLEHDERGMKVVRSMPHTSSSNSGPTKKPSRRGTKPYQQSLIELDSIRYLGGTSLAAEISKKDRPSLCAAAQFFEQGHRLLYSADSLYQHPRNDHVPEMVILGASNAGKSSFLNALIGSDGAAKVSQRPGRTTTMNAFGVGPRPKIPRDLIRKGDAPPRHSLILMDTPGYGFKSQAEWGDTILKYLDVRKMLRGAVLLLPADKRLQDTDKWMLRTLARTNTRMLVVLTKADKGCDGWSSACSSLAAIVRDEIHTIAGTAPRSWLEESGHAAGIYVTAANMGISARLGNGAGIGGVRRAVLDMAGFSLQGRIEKRPETATYIGPVVPFDDLKWKA